MAIDARIPLMGHMPNFADDLAKIEAVHASRDARKLRRAQFDVEQEDRTAERQKRETLADFILSGRRAGPSVPTIGEFQAGASPESPSEIAWRQLVRADPSGALKVRKDKFDIMEREIELVGRLAAGVSDQASYDSALQQAQAMGLEVANLPREYSPELIDRLRKSAAGVSETMAAIARDRRLEWDMADDEIDNARADRVADSQIEDRVERRKLTRQRVMDARERARQASADRRRGQDMRGSPKKSGPVAVLNGRRIVVRGNQWVDEKTGQPVR